jgi:hypothetical protein
MVATIARVINCWALWNPQIPQKALAQRTPLEAARQWQKDNPELFVKTIRKLPVPDT